MYLPIVVMHFITERAFVPVSVDIATYSPHVRVFVDCAGPPYVESDESFRVADFFSVSFVFLFRSDCRGPAVGSLCVWMRKFPTNSLGAGVQGSRPKLIG